MGKRYEETFHWGGYPVVKQADMNMFNIRSKQIKNTRYYYPSIRIAKIKNSDNTICWQGCKEPDYSYMAGENENGTAALGNNLEVS